MSREEKSFGKSFSITKALQDEARYNEICGIVTREFTSLALSDYEKYGHASVNHLTLDAWLSRMEYERYGIRKFDAERIVSLAKSDAYSAWIKGKIDACVGGNLR